jgi:DNA-binding NtrC family response regulator
MGTNTALEILLVDDELGMLEVYAETLQRGLQAVRLVALSDPRTAASTLREGHFDLMVTNVHMPGMNGMRLLRLAKECSPDMPVVVVTGYPMRETAEEARALGAAGYVTKPFDPEDFLSRIRGVLDQRTVSE